MLQTITSSIRRASVALVLLAVPALTAQQPATPAAPVPPQIAAAHKIFISNAGVDINAQAAFDRAGEPNQAYDYFYAAMQTWGRYELVSSPAEADLIFEIRFLAPGTYNGNLPIYQPQFGLTILDTKTHFILWTLATPVEGAFRKATWFKNFNQGLDLLMGNLKILSTPHAASNAPAKN
jgi:hypothetical protein